MNTQDFEAQLRANNFDEIATLEKPVGYAMGEHQHPFEARALITKGDITLVVGGMSTTYGVGDVFHLPAQTPHHENAVPHGVTYLVGRKQQASA
jgi:quercetin dioxygenase-like cupin family protein